MNFVQIQTEVKNTVGRYFDLDIDNPTRKRVNVEARAYYYKLLQNFGRLSNKGRNKITLETIGQSLTPKKHHATVLFAIKVLDNLLAYDNRMLGNYNDLKDMLEKKLGKLPPEFQGKEQVLFRENEELKQEVSRLKDKNNDLNKIIKRYRFASRYRIKLVH